MKKLLLLIIICLGSQQGNAQDLDPDLFRTWYLYEFLLDDSQDNILVANIDPPISPSFTLLNTLEFSGVGDCNTFMGTYTNNGLQMTSTDLTSSNNTCEPSSHPSFEDDYFLYMQDFWYEIYPTSEGLTLRLGSGAFGIAVFKDIALSLNDNSLNKITLIPSPVSETLFITSEGTPIEHISVYSISGQLVLSEKGNLDALNVSGLTAGLYFVEVSTSEGKSIQRFIKK